MGMDVYGKKPKNKKGEYFRANVWGWHPLWDYCQQMHGDLANKVKHGHSNSGDGLEEKDAIELSKRLSKDLATGVVHEYIIERNNYLASLERPVCYLCNGTGIRTDEIGLRNGMPDQVLSPEIQIITGREKGSCNGCSGEGLGYNFETNYNLSKETVGKFAEFLLNCGGFEIC